MVNTEASSTQAHGGSAAVHNLVRRAYGNVAKAQSSCCGGGACCDSSAVVEGHPVPEAELGLSCGNPIAFSEIREGDTVLDLGSGAGKDVFLAAQAAGSAGRAIGVDMTPEMLELARRNALKFEAATGLANTDFREGQIESLPVEDASVDVVISNCVVNLSPDKPQVFREAYRVLRPGGRIVLSDIVLNRPLPAEALKSELLYSSCVSGASLRDDYLAALRSAGFSEPEILSETLYDAASACIDPITSGIAHELDGAASSLTIKAVKH